jgi:hypothetical protein
MIQRTVILTNDDPRKKSRDGGRRFGAWRNLPRGIFLKPTRGHNFWPGLGVSWVVLIFGSRYYLIQIVWQRLGEHGAPAFHTVQGCRRKVYRLPWWRRRFGFEGLGPFGT